MIAIDTDDRIFMDHREIDARAVRANVERSLAENPESAVVVVADKASTTGTAILVMDGCRMAGAKNVSLAARLPDGLLIMTATFLAGAPTGTGKWPHRATAWLLAGVGALGLQPCALRPSCPTCWSGSTEVPVFEQPVANINVIRLKREERPVERELEKPPAPPPEALPQPRFAPTSRPRLALDFEAHPPSAGRAGDRGLACGGTRRNGHVRAQATFSRLATWTRP